MKYGRVSGVEKPVARIVQGTVMIRSEEEGDEEQSFALLDEVFARGGTTFDTAHQYGGATASAPSVGGPKTVACATRSS